MRLVITEKPSVARDIARVLGVRGRHEGYLEGEGLRITWCVGHLLELAPPDHYDAAWKPWRMDTLPMVPASFDLQARKDSSDQWRVVRKLLSDRSLDAVVNACDAGREGELIFRYVVQAAGCRLPVQRLWVSSLTDEAIREGWRNLRPGERYDALGDAARCRSEADWLVGLNATRAMTCRSRDAGGGELLSVGRVQTPTLAMIVGRDREIEAFVPETYWTVEGAMAVVGGPARWKGTWFDPRTPAERREAKDEAEPETPRAERLGDEAIARAIADAARQQTGVLEQAERRRTREKSPLLYDLTALQRRANQRYGLTADQTLAIAQALYEKHKLITYPRTDARYLTSDQAGELPDVLRGVGRVPVYQPFVDGLLAEPLRLGRRVINDAEVGDHHAIIPPGRTPSAQGLSLDEKRVFDLVARRLLAVLSPDAEFDVTTLIVAVEPGAPLPESVQAPLRFRARGKVCVIEGWRAVDPPGRRRDKELPLVSDGDRALVEDTTVNEGRTRPPRPHDDASLLHAMETAGRSLDDAELARVMRSAGLGTPATRAAILQTLLQRKYVERQQKALISTPKGRALIDAVPVEELKSAELTGRWEARLSEIAEGKDRREAFMRDVVANLGAVIDAIRVAELPAAAVVQRDDGPSLGDCPACGAPVRERRAVYSCDTGRSCTFVVFKKMAKRAISVRMVRQLLSDGRSSVVKGFKSKAGKDFEAGLLLEEGGKVGFWFPEREGGGRGRPEEGVGGKDRKERRESAKASPRDAAPSSPVGMRCPRCGAGRIIAGHAAWGCDRYREGCRFVLPFEEGGRRLGDRDAVERIRRLEA